MFYPVFSVFLNSLAVRSVTFFLFLNPLAVRSAFFCWFAFHVPDHAGHARRRRRVSARRGEAPLAQQCDFGHAKPTAMSSRAKGNNMQASTPDYSQ